MKKVSILQLTIGLAEKRIKEEGVTITRQGKPFAVVLGLDLFEEFKEEAGIDFDEFVQKFKQKKRKTEIRIVPSWDIEVK